MSTSRNFTAEEVQKRMKELPPEVRSMLYSSEMVSAIEKVGQKNKLHFDQMGALELETSNVMLGFTETSHFAEILSNSLSIDKNQADTIAKDIDEAILSKIRGSMKQAYEQATATPTAAVSQPAAVNNPPSMPEKSVVMPSSLAAAKPIAPEPTPIATPISTPPSTTAPLSNQVNAPLANLEINAPVAKAPINSAPVNNTPAPIAKPVAAPIHEADVILNEPTVSMPPKVEVAPTSTSSTNSGQAATPAVPNITTKVEPPKPAPIYKADPYREPIE